MLTPQHKQFLCIFNVTWSYLLTNNSLTSQEESMTKMTDDPTVAPPVESMVVSTENNADQPHACKWPPVKRDVTYVLVPPTHYLLGVADLTGELMRMAIHSIGQGDFDLPFEHCKFLRIIYDAFVSFGNVDRDLSRKVHVLRQSLQKVEAACYTLQVRGSEIPKHMLAEAFSKSTADDLLPEEAPSGSNVGY